MNGKELQGGQGDVLGQVGSQQGETLPNYMGQKESLTKVPFTKTKGSMDGDACWGRQQQGALTPHRPPG